MTRIAFPPGVADCLRLTRIAGLIEESGLAYAGHGFDDLIGILHEARYELGLTLADFDVYWQRYRRLLMTGISYYEYVRTAEWGDVRWFALRAARWRCGRCGAGRQFDVHHTTYERRGMERLSDVMPLCVSCHADSHHGDNRQLILDRQIGIRRMRFGSVSRSFARTTQEAFDATS